MLSLLYLGQDKEFEASLQAQSPCRLTELHWFAQRVCQHARDPGANRAATAKLVPRIAGRIGEHFLGQLTLAIAHHLLGEATLAEEAWRRAARNTPPGHPWAHVVTELPPWIHASPPPRLVEEEYGRVYSVVGETRPPGASFGTLGVARFIRVTSGDLILINPVPMTDEIARQVRDLGRVAHIIAPAKHHFEHVMSARRLFPNAQAWGVPAHRGYSRVAGVAFDGFLDDEAPLLPHELDQITFHGNDVGDVWLVDRASSTLITTDVLFYASPSTEAPYSSPFATFYAWAWGVCARNGVPSYQPPMWRDLRRFQAALEIALKMPFEHVAYCHGSWRAIAEHGKSAMRQALGWLLELRHRDALRLTLDFVHRHPVVVYRALRDRR